MNTKPLNGRILVSDCLGRQEFNTQLLYFTGSSLGNDDEHIFMLTDRTGSPNVVVRSLFSGEEKVLTANDRGTLKSYVYFDGTFNKGLGKASVCLDSDREIIYYIQDDKICRTDLQGRITVLNQVPDGRMTAFTHVSADGRRLCVPMTDGRCLDFDPETEGSGVDRRPVYDIDERVQKESLNSYLCVYDTDTGALLYEKTVPKCWITHVQFHPENADLIMYNHEWSGFSCGIRRIWLYDHSADTLRPVRTVGDDTLGSPRGYARKAEDWVCHEMWSDDGRFIIYHGGYADGPAMVGRFELSAGRYWEIALPDWDRGTLEWIPLCRHESDWLGQDAHPHPIYSHAGDRIFFNSRMDRTVNVYCVSSRTPQSYGS